MPLLTLKNTLDCKRVIASDMDRRAFLTSSAHAGVGLTLLPSGTFAGKGARGKWNIGRVAHQAGTKWMYDGDSGRVTNHAAANDYLKKNYRKGWVLNG